MSTCAGAPAPHVNCPHGARCDWTPPDTPRRTLLERISAARLERKVRTPDRALAQIEKLSTQDVTELGTPVYVWPSHQGRATGFEVVCAEHGAMPFLAPSKAKGHVAAARHIKYEHKSAGTVVLCAKRRNITPAAS